MTPREKALQLCQKFGYLGIKWDQAEYTTLSLENAKECALIAVDEIIKSRQEDGSFDDTLSSTSSEYYTPHPMYLTYWQEVKQEIEKL